ncbi:MAG TPA: xanthine dehydrogenase family protein subunit M [Ktedonobacterales bacterium]|nr:xanthine dehydrogenase family protein subunit M [Ktedonobacterales bacterium]
MFPATFDYKAPASLSEALTLLGQNSDAKALAGGQSLLPLMKLRLASPTALIDLRNVPEMKGIRGDGGGVILGAMTSYFQAVDAPLVQQKTPLIVQALRQVGDPQVRARGTIGGSLAHADPAGDLPAVALALNGRMHIVGPKGEREVAARDFFVDMLTTALEPDELLTWARFEATDTPRTGTAYVKHRHPASGYAVVGVAAVVMLDEAGNCVEARVGVTGAGGHAVRATGVEQALSGKPFAATAAEASAHAADGLDLLSDTYASAEYRGHLTRVLTLRALNEAAQRAHG